MTDLRQAAQQALETLGCLKRDFDADQFEWEISDVAITALREALAQPEPEQEPVAFYHPRNGFYWAKPTSIFAPTSVDVEPMPLYTNPAQRPWQGLTERST